MRKRMIFLLKKASEAFSRYSDPFCVSWLRDYQVTLDECGELSSLIAVAIEYYLDDIEEAGGSS